MPREMAVAVATSDNGRVYEVFKVNDIQDCSSVLHWRQITYQTLPFKFAGSTHKNYMDYTLESEVDMERESPPALAKAFKLNWTVNSEGIPGHDVEGDLNLEHSNRDLQAIRVPNNHRFDSPYVRKVISPNLGRFQTAKKMRGEGLGLKRASGKHEKPHKRPEERTLTQLYRETNLHVFVPGRAFSDPAADKVDHLEKGVEHLAIHFTEWTAKTSARRSLLLKQATDLQAHWDRRDAIDAENMQVGGEKEDSAEGSVAD